MDTLLYKVVPYSEITKMADAGYLNNLLSDLDGKPYQSALIPFEDKKDVIPHIITSYNCNYKCSYCYQKTQKMGKEYMTNDHIENILLFYHNYDQIFETNTRIKRVGVSGGEPLLPQNKDLIKGIISTWDSIPIDFTTNGAFIEFYESILKNHKKITLTVSVDGVKNIHYIYRKPMDDSYYDLMIKGVDWALSERIPVTISSVFHPEFLDYYSFLFDKLETIGWMKNDLLQVRFSLLASGVGEDVDLNYLDRTLHAITLLKKKDTRINNVDLSRLLPGCRELFSALFNANTKHMYTPYKCDALHSPSYTFTPNGTVLLCSCIDNESGIVGRFWPEIEIYVDRIQEIRNRRIDTLAKCNNCVKRVMCKGGCLATALSKGYPLKGVYCGMWEDPTFLKSIESFWPL